MGSLLPGWDTAPSVPTHELSEDEAVESPPGYFAKLEKTRSMRKTTPAAYDGTVPAGSSAFAVPGTQSISRRASIGHDSADAYAHLSLQRQSTPGTMLKGAELRRTSTTTVYGSKGKPGSYALTDWEKELDALRTKKPASHHVHHSPPKAKGVHESPWWHRTDGGALNMAHPEEAEDRNAQHGTFVPQFAIRSLSIRDATPEKAL